MSFSDRLPDDAPSVPAAPSATSERLLVRARRGEQSALNALVARHFVPLQRWAHARLPMWARSLMDTADLVQESLINTLPYLDRFEPRGRGALRAYLCRAIDNRIKDEMRKVGRRGVPDSLEDVHADRAPSPLDEALTRESEARYQSALSLLQPMDRQLIVGRLELGYSFEQLALVTGKRRPDSARVALHRALVRLAEAMADV